MTDTFYYYGDLVVTSEVQSYDLTLTRAVAMFRMVLTDDEIPSTVTKFKFYYTGGSSTFSPSAGYGCVNSKQTEIRTVADGVTTFDIFTLPHTEEDVLTKLTVTALDANDNTVKERVFENVPVTATRSPATQAVFSVAAAVARPPTAPSASPPIQIGTA